MPKSVKVSITYCLECGYQRPAFELAESLIENFQLMLSGVELVPETGGVIPTTLHELGLAWKLISLPGTLRQIGNETDPGKRERLASDFQSKLYSENKCPDFVVNRGHYFGADKFGEEPGLSDQDKEALIAFLKTF